MSARKWLLIFFMALLAGLSGVAAFNWWMDPYMFFENSHSFNQKQSSHTEFEMKTLHLSRNPERYTQILMGGSSAAHIRVGPGTFNFAISGFTLRSAEDGIQYVLKTQPGVRRIIIGVDGFQYLINFKRPKADVDFSRALDRSWHYRRLLDITMLKLSLKNFFNNFFPITGYYYDRELKVSADPQNKVRYPDDLFKGTRRDTHYTATLKRIKSVSDVEIIFYTSPMSEEWLRTWHRYRKEDYRNWLQELVNVNGKLEHFAWLSDIVKTSSGNFTSDTHFYTPVGERIYSHLTGNRQNDIAVTLTSENLESELLREEKLFGE